MKPTIIAITIAVMLTGITFLVKKNSDKQENNILSNAIMGDSVAIMGRNHINIGDDHEEYNSNPPTSGPHAGPARWGFNSNEIADENAIHNLEHGGIWITYKNLGEEDVNVLRKISLENPNSVLVSPRALNDTSIAVTSWGRLLNMDSVDVNTINEFIKNNKNKSPEKLAR